MPVATRARSDTNREYKWTDEHLSDFLDTTTIAGVFHVFRDRSRIRRIIWAVVLIAAILACTVMVLLSLLSFFRRPTASTITVNSIDESGSSFPAVTICNLNVKRNPADALSDELYPLINHLFNPDEEFVLHSRGFNSSTALNQCMQTIDNITAMERALQIWSILSADNFIHYCGFHSGADSEVISCENNFRPVLTTAGICYTYNGIQNGRPDVFVTATGVRYGLKLILNIDQETHPSLDGLAGVKVIVHERNDIPRPNLYGISIPPGQNVDIGVKKAIRIDETTQSNCIPGHRLELLPDFEYSQFACRENALLEHIAQEDACGCLLQIRHDRPTTGPYANTPNCTFNDICCLINEFDTFDQYSNCPLPCHFEYYQIEDSYSSFPRDPYLDELAVEANMTLESVRDNFISVHVFFQDLEITTSIIQYTYSSVALFADIGGQLGLFLGISIISIFEVLILFFDELKKICITDRCSKEIETIEKTIPTLDIMSTVDEEHNSTGEEEKPTVIDIEEEGGTQEGEVTIIESGSENDTSSNEGGPTDVVIDIPPPIANDSSEMDTIHHGDIEQSKIAEDQSTV